ncbi:MAG: hypothetical protein WCC87_25985 [Candidatus Korobacteraceae bacterium]
MSAETRKVLEMLAEGKITPADAERLLEKLAAVPDSNGNPGQQESPTASTPPNGAKKFLRVLIERPGGDDVNVRVPLSFVRSGIRLAGVLPPKVMDKLREEGIDPKFFGEQTEETLNELQVDMETKSGKHVRVFCE